MNETEPGTAVVTDSTSQLPAELARRYSIEVVPVVVSIDGKSYDETELDADSFYAQLAEGGHEITTSQPSPGTIGRVYEELAARGHSSVVSVHVGEQLSGTLNSARVAAAEADLPVVLVDTETTSMGTGLCALGAAEAVASGADERAAAHRAETIARAVSTVFVAPSAEQLRRRSHLPVDEPTGDGIAVFASTADRLSAVAEVAALDETVGPMTEVVTAQGGPLRVAVGYGDRAVADVADLLARALSDAGVGEVIRYRAGPSIGLHVGAGTVGAFFHPV